MTYLLSYLPLVYLLTYLLGQSLAGIYLLTCLVTHLQGFTYLLAWSLIEIKQRILTY